MSARGVVGRAVDGDHRTEGDVGGGPIAERGERTAAHQGRHVAQDARLLADGRHPMPRLHRHEHPGVGANLGGEVVEQRRARADVGIEEHERLLGRGQRSVPARIRLAEPPVRRRRWGDHLGAERASDAGGAVGRVVVDHHDPVTGATLLDERTEQVGERVRLVAGGDDHRNGRRVLPDG